VHAAERARDERHRRALHTDGRHRGARGAMLRARSPVGRATRAPTVVDDVHGPCPPRSRVDIRGRRPSLVTGRDDADVVARVGQRVGRLTMRGHVDKCPEVTTVIRAGRVILDGRAPRSFTGRERVVACFEAVDGKPTSWCATT
jgi:hypothetical protein